MGPTILTIDESLCVREGLKILLERNGYEVIQASNGEEGLKVLEKRATPPDLIISAIKMAKMDGYTFFKEVTKDPKYAKNPFLFLSYANDPEEIQYANSLGADGFIAKPIRPNIFLSIIKGKLERNKLTELNAKKFEKRITSVHRQTPVDSTLKENKTFLILVTWDERYGPTLVGCIPDKKNAEFVVEDISSQLFNAAVVIYGQQEYTSGETVLLRITNINSMGFLYFSWVADTQVRGNRRLFMIGLIAPIITQVNNDFYTKLFSAMGKDYIQSSNVDLSCYFAKIQDLIRL